MVDKTTARVGSQIIKYLIELKIINIKQEEELHSAVLHLQMKNKDVFVRHWNPEEMKRVEVF